MTVYLSLFLQIFRTLIVAIDSFHLSENLTMLDFLIYSTLSVAVINLVVKKLNTKGD
ncbi:MAG: hypothetical protein MJ232_04600 [archaeon]|nr:hypothetical protein [archaeon]